MVALTVCKFILFIFLSANKIFTPMIDEVMQKLHKCQVPTESEIQKICDLASELLIQEENVISVPAPVTVCGDIHGQIYDLFELLKIGGLPPHTNYLFMGDYVDRGYHSVETVTYLLCLKIKHPSRIWLLRGNHESRQITQVYGFYDECIRKFGTPVIWRMFTDLFDILPIAAVVNNSTFCCHGGLSPSFDTIDQLQEIDRRVEVPHEGIMCDLLWSDPDEMQGWGQSPRGAGFTFGADITEGFCKRNGLNMICRAHQLVNEGFNWNHDKSCVTIFSAPNYCYRCGNLASLMEMDEKGTHDFTQFESSPTKIEDFASSKIPDYFL